MIAPTVLLPSVWLPFNPTHYDGPVTDSQPTWLPVILGAVGVLVLIAIFATFIVWLMRGDRRDKEAGLHLEESPFFETRENPYEEQFRRKNHTDQGNSDS
ncbi:hypothetical protein HMPREF3160_01650 [Arthrobacter sp. HMSC06H05]|uniref:hypothetical protein n=1 Tax=Arthrobacter sp. HMSC06H05 TaxID=1581128 RepID=UPI0008A4D801|nr:hypothetical protein [Arthrobacter sp. HMSC06H05]OFT43967.1 hypothetical protein HMPREF3160_01650 [Arthrobacter sp. HMSC06H05]